MLCDSNVVFYVSIFITGTSALTRNVTLPGSRDLGHKKWWAYVEQAIADKVRRNLFSVNTWEKQVMTHVFWNIIGFDICQDEKILISDFGIESEKPEKQVYALCADITIEATFERKRTDNVVYRQLGAIVNIVGPKPLALNLTLLRLDKDSDPIACRQHLFKLGYKTSSNDVDESTSIVEMCGIPYAHNVFVPSYEAVFEFEHYEEQHHEVVELQVQAIYPIYGNSRMELPVSVPIGISAGDHLKRTIWRCGNSTQFASINMSPTCYSWYRNPGQAPLLGVVQLLGNQLHLSALRIWTLETPLHKQGQFLFRQVSIYFPPQDCNNRKKDMTAIFDGPYLGILTANRVQTPFAKLFEGSCLHLNSSVVYKSSIGELTVSWANPMHLNSSSVVFGYRAQPLPCPGPSCLVQTIPVNRYSDAMVTIHQKMRPTIHMLKFVKTNRERHISLKVSATYSTLLHWREDCTMGGIFITEIMLKAAICSRYGITLLNTSMVRRPLYFHNSEVVIAVKSYPNIFSVEIDVIYSATRCMGFFNAYATLSHTNSLKTTTCSIEFASGGRSTQVIMNGDSTCCFSMDYFPIDDKDLRKHIKNSVKLTFETRNHEILNLNFTVSRKTTPTYKGWECFNLGVEAADVLVAYNVSNIGSFLYFRPNSGNFMWRKSFVDSDTKLETSLANVYLYPVSPFVCDSTWTWYGISASIPDQALDGLYVSANEFSFNSGPQPLFEYEPAYILGRIHLPQKAGRTYSFTFNRWNVKMSRMPLVVPSHIDFSITQTTKVSLSRVYGTNIFEFVSCKYAQVRYYGVCTRVQYTGHALRLTLNDIPGPAYEAVRVHYVNFYNFVQIQYRVMAITKENMGPNIIKANLGFQVSCTDSRCYAFQSRPRDSSWSNCRVICNKHGWELLSINSETEWKEVKSFLESVKNFHLAIIYLSLRSSEVSSAYKM